MTGESTVVGDETDPASDDAAVPPGPSGVPIIGTLHRYLRDPLGFMENCALTYGDVVFTNVGPSGSYMLTHPDHVERVLVTDDDRFRKAAAGQGRLEPLFGDGLVTSDGSWWRRQRTRMQPAFRPDRLATYAEIMGRRAAAMADDWELGETIQLDEEMRRLTLSILVRSLFGSDLERETEIREAFAAMLSRFDGVNLWLPDWLPTPANRRFARGRDRLDAIVYDLIDERRGAAATRTDLLSTLLVAETDDGERMTDEQIRDEVVTLLAAGHDTTALALTYTWHLLETHPDASERLRGELDETAFADRDVGMSDLSALEYTKAVVTEAMRLYPPTPATAREPIEDVTFEGYTIPADSPIFLPQWVVHRDDRFYDDPQTFRPERWLTERDRPEYAYFPFGGGPRHCLGHRFATVEAQLVLATIARRWKLTPFSDGSLSVRPSITLRPTEPVEVVVRDRPA